MSAHEKTSRVQFRCAEELRRALDRAALTLGEDVSVVARMAVRDFLARLPASLECRQ